MKLALFVSLPMVATAFSPAPHKRLGSSLASTRQRRTPELQTTSFQPQLGNPVGGQAGASIELTDPLEGPAPADIEFARAIDVGPTMLIQGGALRTWSSTKSVERFLVMLRTEGPPEGTPQKSQISFCQGPDNTPMKMEVFSGKGNLRKFRAVIEAPGGGSLFIRNIMTLEFPIIATVNQASDDGALSEEDAGLVALDRDIYDMRAERILQGHDSVVSYHFPNTVDQVKVTLRTNGRPMNAMVELIQGPNAPKETIELYTEDAYDMPFFTVIDTPGAGNTVRIVNTGPVEFPLVCAVEPFVA